jgi:hypothetical protein
MSKGQQPQLDAILRQGRLDTAGKVTALRATSMNLGDTCGYLPMSNRVPSKSEVPLTSRSPSGATRPQV